MGFCSTWLSLCGVSRLRSLGKQSFENIYLQPLHVFIFGLEKTDELVKTAIIVYI